MGLNIFLYISGCGEMAEWSKAAVLKTVRGASSSGVRIPLSPPFCRAEDQAKNDFTFDAARENQLFLTGGAGGFTGVNAGVILFCCRATLIEGDST